MNLDKKSLKELSKIRKELEKLQFNKIENVSKINNDDRSGEES